MVLFLHPLAAQCPTTNGAAAHRLYFTPADAARHARYMADPDTDGSLIGLCRAMDEQFQDICKKFLTFYPIVAARNLWAR